MAALTSSSSSSKVCAGCGVDGATLACPSCVKLRKAERGTTTFGEVDFFCSQQCFKEQWPTHKKKHGPWEAAIERERGLTLATSAEMPLCYRNYADWTGALRPYPRGSPEPSSRRRAIPDSVAKPDYWLTGDPASEHSKRTGIPIYSKEQIEGIRRACEVGREVLDECGRAVKKGATTSEIDQVCFEACLERGAYPSPLNYYNFPCSVCTSVNEVICHGIPDLRELRRGDAVNVDVSVFVDGYHGDLNETYIVGRDPESELVTEVAFRCLEAAAKLIKPGTCYREIGAVIDKLAKSKGCSVVRTYCGHGIGELFHTAPNVPHHAKNKAPGIMKPGHIFTVEPMINLSKSWRDTTWPDQWTAVTLDGAKSAQFEHTFLVTDDGYDILTKRHEEPVMLWDLHKQLR